MIHAERSKGSRSALSLALLELTRGGQKAAWRASSKTARHPAASWVVGCSWVQLGAGGSRGSGIVGAVG